jgi:hypothetical protein
MARTPASNPTPTPGRSAYPGGVKGNSAKQKRGGSVKRTPTVTAKGGVPSSGQRTTAKAVTTRGGGGTGGLPLGQQASPGRQGLPPSGYESTPNTDPIPDAGH